MPAGIGLFVLSFAFVLSADGLLPLLFAQIPQGTAVAVIGVMGIQHSQAVMAPASGAAAALFSNATTAGSLVAGVIAGGLIQLTGTVSPSPYAPVSDCWPH